MRQLYDPQEEDWKMFLADDNYLQIGNGIGYDTNYFQGYPLQQYGGGIGDIFQSLYRFLLPIGKKIVGSLGDEGLKTANRMLNEIVENNNGSVQKVIKNQVKTGVKNLMKRAGEADILKGEGRRAKKLRALGGPLKRRQDIFGAY